MARLMAPDDELAMVDLIDRSILVPGREFQGGLGASPCATSTAAWRVRCSAVSGLQTGEA
ncbi:hypothetical protein OG462_44275 [Streptomyces sp. NBC_01077]|uniref:hypothetical protein n=1 Tax=Streptomyces sp. NBC_01077 TaxID=2903746 RepID=UPI00386663CC|nr:hypothetical protein OG462_00730 [Streptomyces sp. NBC_01077]WSV43728.1 hypothetical protein OG462_44275 [Streptomyces sp. NBC_01077]